MHSSQPNAENNCSLRFSPQGILGYVKLTEFDLLGDSKAPSEGNKSVSE